MTEEKTRSYIHPYWMIAAGALGLAVIVWFVVMVVAPIICFLMPRCGL